MIIAVLGAGNVGQGLATRFAAAGHDVRLANSRGPATLADVAALTGAKPDHLGLAVADADVVALAVPYFAVADVAAAGGPWDGKVVIDATNFFEQRDGAELRPGAHGSSAEVQRQLAGSFVVKAFNTIPARLLLGADSPSGGQMTIPLASDDEKAGRIVEDLVTEMGFVPLRVGQLAVAAPLMDVAGALFGRALSPADMRAALGHASRPHEVGARHQTGVEKQRRPVPGWLCKHELPRS
jgi:predicted dinucleotide-binding enzyme